MTTYKNIIKNLIENLEKTQYNDDVKKIDELLIEAVNYANENNIAPIKQKILLKFIFFRLKCPFSFLFSNKQDILRKLAPFTKKLVNKIKIVEDNIIVFEYNEKNPYMDKEMTKFKSFEKCLPKRKNTDCLSLSPGSAPDIDTPICFYINHNEIKVKAVGPIPYNTLSHYEQMKKYPSNTGIFFPEFSQYLYKGPNNSLVCCECSDINPENMNRINQDKFPRATSVFANSEYEVKHAIDSYKKFKTNEKCMIKRYNIKILDNSVEIKSADCFKYSFYTQYKNGDIHFNLRITDSAIWKYDGCNDSFVTYYNANPETSRSGFLNLEFEIIATSIVDVEYLALKYYAHNMYKYKVYPNKDSYKPYFLDNSAKPGNIDNIKTDILKNANIGFFTGSSELYWAVFLNQATFLNQTPLYDYVIYDDTNGFTLLSYQNQNTDLLNETKKQLFTRDSLIPTYSYVKGSKTTTTLKESQQIIFFKMQTNKGKMIQFNSGGAYKNKYKNDVLYVPSPYNDKKPYIMYAWADNKGNCILFNESAKNNGFRLTDYTIIIMHNIPNQKNPVDVAIIQTEYSNYLESTYPQTLYSIIQKGYEISKYQVVDSSHKYEAMKKYPTNTGKFFPINEVSSEYIYKGPNDNLVCCECSDINPENMNKIKQTKFPRATSVFAKSPADVKFAIESYKKFRTKEAKCMIQLYNFSILNNSDKIIFNYRQCFDYSLYSTILQKNLKKFKFKNTEYTIWNKNNYSCVLTFEHPPNSLVSKQWTVAASNMVDAKELTPEYGASKTEFISYNFNTKKQTVLDDRDLEDISQSTKNADYGENNFITGQYFKNNQKTSKQFWGFVADIKNEVLIYDDYTNFNLFCLNRNLANIKIEDFVNPLGFFPKAGQPTEAPNIKSSQHIIFFKMQTNRGKMIQFNSGIEYKNKTDILHVPSPYNDNKSYIMYAWADSQGNCILFNETGIKNGFAPNDYTFMMTNRIRPAHIMLLNEYKLFYNSRRAGRAQSPLPSVYSPQPPVHLPQPSVYSPQPAAGGIPTLDNVLTIYSGYGNKGKGFLGKNYEYCDRIFKHNTSFRKMADSMRIIYLDQFDKPDVMTHLKYRHPIHIGGPTYSDNGNMKRYLGYSKEDALNIDVELGPKNIRYSIVGWTPLISEIANEAYICHTWGVNLESRTTTDGQYVFSSGVCDDAKYFELMGLMMCQIEAAANEVYKQTNKKVVMRVSKLGLGVWASELKVKDIVPDKYIERYRTLLVLMSKDKPWLTIFHPDYDNKKTFKIQNNQISDAYPGNNHAANTFADPFGPPNSIPSDSILLIINAWDDRSFIGNRGSTDSSLDGWIVSGSVAGKRNENWQGEPIGSNFTNACYLHNSFFHPSLFTDEQKSIRIHC